MYDDDFNYDDNNKNQSGWSLFYETNKKLVWLLVGIIIFIIILTIFIKTYSKKNNVIVDATPIVKVTNNYENISRGNTMIVYGTVENYPNGKVTWSSSDSNVATVDQNGLVKGINYGTVKIIATYNHTDGLPYSAECEITVSDGNPSVKITNVKFPDGEIIMSIGNTYSAPAIIEPSGGYIKNIMYTSSNTAVATVTNEGVIKGVGVGSASIIINVNDGEFVDDILVNVVSDKVSSQVLVLPKIISFNENEKTINVGDSFDILYNIYPQNVTPSIYTWKSSDKSVATVNENGHVVALKEGKTEIILKSDYVDVSDKLILNVVKTYVVPEAIMISSTSILSMKVGDFSQINATVSPTDAVNKTISYSSNSNVASVDQYGIVKAIGVGEAIITLSTFNGKTATVKVIVTKNDGSSSSGGNYSISITSNTKTVNSSYDSVMSSSALTKTPSTVTVDFSGLIKKVKICINNAFSKGDSECDPRKNYDMILTSSGKNFVINTNGVTQFSYVAYDENDNEVTSGSRYLRMQLDSNSACYYNTVDGSYVWGKYTASNFVLKSQYTNKRDCLNNK